MTQIFEIGMYLFSNSIPGSNINNQYLVWLLDKVFLPIIDHSTEISFNRSLNDLQCIVKQWKESDGGEESINILSSLPIKKYSNTYHNIQVKVV